MRGENIGGVGVFTGAFVLAGGVAILGVSCVLTFVKPIESTLTSDTAMALP